MTSYKVAGASFKHIFANKLSQYIDPPGKCAKSAFISKKVNKQVWKSQTHSSLRICKYSAEYTDNCQNKSCTAGFCKLQIVFESHKESIEK